MGLWKQHFHWSVLLDWVVLAVIVPTILAIAGLLLVFDQFGGANVCFVITTLFVFSKIVQLSVVSQDAIVSRVLFTFLLFGLSGVGIVEAVRGVNHWRDRKEAKAPSETEKTPPVVPEMKPWITASNAEYPVGTVLGGISWSNRFTELRVNFGNAALTEYHDLDFTIVPDEPVAAIGQITNVPDVSFSAAVDQSFRQEFIEGATGRRIANPLVLIASGGGYRVRCKALPSNARLEILMAIGRIIDFPTTGQKTGAPYGGIFERTYALRVSQQDGISHWYGHGKDQQGKRIEDVYKTERVLPKTVKIDGRYTNGDEVKPISERVEVKDIVEGLLRRGPDPGHQ
jgi:hypothetical protein